MKDEPDVRLEGVTHEQILDWVRQGRAATSTHILEDRLRKVIDGLKDAAHDVNSAVQKAPADWEGAAADSASTVMAFLRDFDDELHTLGTADRYSAMGQSGESAATRDRVPPIPLDLDGQHSILGSTVDPKVRIDARRQAEARAREVLAEYQEATRHRLAGLPRITPVPSIVLDTSTSAPGPGGATASPGPVAAIPAASGGKQGASKPRSPAPSTTKPSERPAQEPDPEPVPTAPQATGQASAGQAVGRASGGPAAVGVSGAARGDPGTAGSPPPAVVGGIAAVPIGGNTAPPAGEPEVGGVKGGQRAEPGPKSAVERVVERQQVGSREAAPRRASGSGTAGVLGGAAGAPDGKDDEHQNRYRVPSGEPFDAEEVEYDGEFLVAPDVIGGPE